MENESGGTVVKRTVFILVFMGLLLAQFDISEKVIASDPLRKPVTEKSITFPEYFGTYTVFKNGETS